MLLHNTLIVLCRHMRCQCTFASRRAVDAASASACAAISVPLIINICLPIYRKQPTTVLEYQASWTQCCFGLPSTSWSATFTVKTTNLIHVHGKNQRLWRVVALVCTCSEELFPRVQNELAGIALQFWLHSCICPSLILKTDGKTAKKTSFLIVRQFLLM